VAIAYFVGLSFSTNLYSVSTLGSSTQDTAVQPTLSSYMELK